jgi:hypothetical protein
LSSPAGAAPGAALLALGARAVVPFAATTAKLGNTFFAASVSRTWMRAFRPSAKQTSASPTCNGVNRARQKRTQRAVSGPSRRANGQSRTIAQGFVYIIQAKSGGPFKSRLGQSIRNAG